MLFRKFSLYHKRLGFHKLFGFRLPSWPRLSKMGDWCGSDCRFCWSSWLQVHRNRWPLRSELWRWSSWCLWCINTSPIGLSHVVPLKSCACHADGARGDASASELRGHVGILQQRRHARAPVRVSECHSPHIDIGWVETRKPCVQLVLHRDGCRFLQRSQPYCSSSPKLRKRRKGLSSEKSNENCHKHSPCESCAGDFGVCSDGWWAAALASKGTAEWMSDRSIGLASAQRTPTVDSPSSPIAQLGGLLCRCTCCLAGL